MAPGWTPERFATALAALSDRQRQALRLVARGHDSKTIAPRFGKSHHTIHKDLEHAKTALAARDRFEAARWLVDFEAQNYEAFVYEPQALPAGEKSGILSSSEAMGTISSGSSIAEERAQFAFDSIGAAAGAMAPPGAEVQIRNRLQPWQLAAIAIAGAVAAVVMLAGMLAVFDRLQPLIARIFTG